MQYPTSIICKYSGYLATDHSHGRMTVKSCRAIRNVNDGSGAFSRDNKPRRLFENVSFCHTFIVMVNYIHKMPRARMATKLPSTLCPFQIRFITIDIAEIEQI